MSILKGRKNQRSRLVKKNTTTSSRPTDQEVQVSCPTTDKSTILETTHNVNAVTNTNTSNISTILETNHNVNAVTNANTSNASFRLSSKVNTSSKIIKKEFRSNSSNYFSNVSDSSPSKSNSENNPSIINLFSWDEFLTDHEKVIPPDASLLP